MRKIIIYYAINFLVARDDAFCGSFFFLQNVLSSRFSPLSLSFSVLGEGDDEWTDTLLRAYVTLSIIHGGFFEERTISPRVNVIQRFRGGNFCSDGKSEGKAAVKINCGSSYSQLRGVYTFPGVYGETTRSWWVLTDQIELEIGDVEFN